MSEKKLYGYTLFIIGEKIKFRIGQNFLSLILLLCIANFYAYTQLVKNQDYFAFYQTEFAPAVMYACGYGFSNPVYEQHIDAFLNKKTNTVSCEDIQYQPIKPLSAFQSAEYYFILSAGVIWNLFGIGWDRLIPLFLILYSGSVAATYCIFRLAMRRSISFLLSLIIATSSLQMSYLLKLRDYSVAPFLLWTIWISAQLVIANPNLKKRVLLCAGAGLITGVGLGFRTDLLVLIPYFILMFLLFVKKGSSFFLSKIVPLLIFLISFLIVSYPILHKTLEFGSNLPHVIILGLANEFTQYLALQQSKIYSLIPAYMDVIAYSVINSFAERAYGLSNLLLSPSKEYDHYGSLYLLNYGYYFPADFLIRIYASIYQVLIIPFQGYSGTFFSYFKKISILFPFFSLTIIAFYQLRWALLILFSVTYLCSYPVLQFGARHYFYLDFIGLWFLGFLGEYSVSFFYKENKSAYIQYGKSLIQSHWKIVFATAVLCSTTGYGLLIAARIYQNNVLTQLFNQYAHLPSQTLLERNSLNKNEMSIPLPTKIPDSTHMSLETFFIKITTENCLASEIRFQLNFWKEPDLSWNISREIQIPGNSGVYFFPIYNFYNPGPTVISECSLPSYWINSIHYSSKDNSCLKEFSIVNTENKLPLLFNLNLESGWENNKLYQSF